MARLLHIQSSITQGHSVSRKLSDQMVAEWAKTHPATEIDLLDLVENPLPHFGPDNLGAMMVPPEQQTPAMRAAASLSDRLITQLEGVDLLVIGCPMYNFSIPSQLKSWFDHVTLAGRTFKYSEGGLPKGMLFGKKTFVIETRGGDYSEAPVSSWDFQEPLLRALLGFIGLFDVHFARAEGLRQNQDEVPFILRTAQEKISRLAA